MVSFPNSPWLGRPALHFIHAPFELLVVPQVVAFAPAAFSLSRRTSSSTLGTETCQKNISKSSRDLVRHFLSRRGFVLEVCQFCLQKVRTLNDANAIALLSP